MLGDNGLRPPDTNAHDHEHEFAAILASLGESPETVIPLHMLQQGTCEVVCVGDPHDPEGVIIQSTVYPEEPIAFGAAEAIGSILPSLTGWTCLNVPADLADALADDVRRAAGASSVRTQDDVYHVLDAPVPEFPMPDVRLMSPADGSLFRSPVADLGGVDAAWLLENLRHGHVAGAVRDGRVVSIAHTFATSESYADLGVTTVPGWRRQGLATAAAALVSRAIQSAGRIPVWSCGGTNEASLAAAGRLGFREVSRRVYLIPVMETEADAGGATA